MNKGKILILFYMLFFLLMSSKSYAKTTEDGLFEYYIKNDCITIINIKGEDDVDIPRKIEGYPVTVLLDLGECTTNIPDSVLEINISGNDRKLFNKVKYINVDEKNPNFSSIDGILFNKAKTKIIWYPSDRNDKKYTIPVSVTEIGDFAFFGCQNLEKIDLPTNLTKIR